MTRTDGHHIGGVWRLFVHECPGSGCAVLEYLRQAEVHKVREPAHTRRVLGALANTLGAALIIGLEVAHVIHAHHGL